MLRFIQKSSDNTEKIIFTLISEINESEKISSEKIAEFCFFFKICNFFSKTSILSWINLSSQFLKNFLCLCKYKNLMLSWINFSRSCCWQTWMNFFSISRNFLTCKIWWISANQKSSVRKYFFSNKHTCYNFSSY